MFGAENHTYYVRHLIENLLMEVAKLGIKRNASKDLVKKMFNPVVYATTIVEYDSAIGELRRFKRELVVWSKTMNLSIRHSPSSKKRGGVS